MYKKLFIPGPTHVREEILQAQTAPMIGHRAKEYSDLQGRVTPNCNSSSTLNSPCSSTPVPAPA